jgi:hypothetical protein
VNIIMRSPHPIIARIASAMGVVGCGFPSGLGTVFACTGYTSGGVLDTRHDVPPDIVVAIKEVGPKALTSVLRR